jgi:dolichyl-phosphate beta-glucosyltransferase
MPGPPAPHLSIVIPAYNEARRLSHSLDLLREFFSSWAAGSVEILIVVEHSTDGTLDLAKQAVAEQANFQVIDNRVHRGKGFAVRSGMLQARGAIVLFMDADLSVPLEEIGKFLAWLDAHPADDVLLGSRQHADSRIERRQGLLRQTMGKTFNRVLRTLSLIPFRDTQCGFKAFRAAPAREIFALQTIDGFAFDVEIILLAQALGYRIAELPVRWLNSPESKVHIVGDSVRMLMDVFTMRTRVNRMVRQQKIRAAKVQPNG